MDPAGWRAADALVSGGGGEAAGTPLVASKEEEAAAASPAGFWPSCDRASKRLESERGGRTAWTLSEVFLRPWTTTSAHDRWWLGVEQEDGRGPEGSQGTVSWRAAEREEICSAC